MARQMLQKSTGKDVLCFMLGTSSYVRACAEHLYLGAPPRTQVLSRCPPSHTQES